MMYQVNALPGSIYLGRQTEFGVNTIQIDCSEWLKMWPELEISAWVTRPGEEAAYPVMVQMEGNCLAWNISDADTAIAGAGKLEIIGLADGQRKLSAVVGTYIRESLVGSTTEPPEGAQPDSTNTYKKGDKVIHNGKTWVSDVDNNSWEPGVYGWSEIG